MLRILEGRPARAPSTRSSILAQTPLPGSATANYLTGGPDGAVWFVDQINNMIGRIQTGAASASQVTEYSIPTANSLARKITVGPDGNLWFAEENAGKIARVSW